MTQQEGDLDDGTLSYGRLDDSIEPNIPHTRDSSTGSVEAQCGKGSMVFQLAGSRR
jgi:hypothetical protein